jgi:hypothetical protein
MRKPHLAGLGLLVALLPLPAVGAENRHAFEKTAGTEAMAQNHTEEEAVPGRDILVAGAGATINARSAARIRIDIGPQPLPPHPKLALSLAPSDVSADEAYLVVVDAVIGAGTKRLGTVSFYPARAGAVQSFYFDAAPVIADMKARGTTQAELTLSLAPVERTQALTTSEVRIVGARLVGS